MMHILLFLRKTLPIGDKPLHKEVMNYFQVDSKE